MTRAEQILAMPYVDKPRPSERNGHAKASGKPKRKSSGRFETINSFSDSSARALDPVAQCCWFHLWRETKSNGNVSISHSQLAKRIGKSRRTIIRAIKQLENAKLLTVVKRGGQAAGMSVYHLHGNPK